MKIADLPYRTMRQLKNDPRLPFITMSTFDHSVKETSSWLMISLMIPLAMAISNHFGMALTLSNIASPKAPISWPLLKASLSKNPSTGCISRNFTLKSSHSTLGYFFLFSVFNLFSPALTSKISLVLLTDASSSSLPHWLHRRCQPLDTKSHFGCLGSLHPLTRNATFKRHMFGASHQQPSQIHCGHWPPD
jgi:hypothetical protein